MRHVAIDCAIVSCVVKPSVKILQVYLGQIGRSEENWDEQRRKACTIKSTQNTIVGSPFVVVLRTLTLKVLNLYSLE